MASKRRFPTFAVILLVIGIVWLLNELQVLSINLPWIPAILVIIAIGMIINRYVKKLDKNRTFQGAVAS